jgi:hypothetical protein
LAESTNAQCVKKFCAAVVELFEGQWLRLPTMDDIREIEIQYRKLGFPGGIGCLDCASWEWDACPIGWQGLCKGKDSKPVLRMEGICDDFLWIWWVNFGAPGAKNDVQIFHHSPLFNSIRTGVWPPALPQIDIAGYPLKWFYLLTDGI